MTVEDVLICIQIGLQTFLLFSLIFGLQIMEELIIVAKEYLDCKIKQTGKYDSRL